MHVSRREFLGAAIGGLASALLPRCLSASADDRDAKLDGLLIEMERRICLFFYEQVDPVTGLVKDRARHSGADAHTISSIAATGFGLSAMCIAHANSFLKPADALQRVQQMLEFLAACVQARMSIVISGGTGSGKTTLLNLLSGFIPNDERVATIEDAAEAVEVELT